MLNRRYVCNSGAPLAAQGMAGVCIRIDTHYGKLEIRLDEQPEGWAGRVSLFSKHQIDPISPISGQHELSPIEG